MSGADVYIQGVPSDKYQLNHQMLLFELSRHFDLTVEYWQNHQKLILELGRLFDLSDNSETDTENLNESADEFQTYFADPNDPIIDCRDWFPDIQAQARTEFQKLFKQIDWD